mmetsp:Transcript_85426/g.160872  ORF Transcript_85426/g.160872 Transcript_85426/m.160872 type:complete len:582 (+) Transcript_85426:78-1823(+)
MKYLLSAIWISCLLQCLCGNDAHAENSCGSSCVAVHDDVVMLQVSTDQKSFSSPSRLKSSRAQHALHGHSRDASHVRSRHQHLAAGTLLPDNDAFIDGSSDWFFSTLTKSCDGGEIYDIDSRGIFARIVMCLLVASCLAVLLATSSTQGPLDLTPTKSPLTLAAAARFTAPQTDENASTGSELLDAADGKTGADKRERLWHLDFARICAIGCVIFEHAGGEAYTWHNVAWGLWWALPFLYITSGMGNVMSRSSMTVYAGRLVAILVVGVSANLVADICTGRDWQDDFPNTVFQMWFVVMLIFMTIVAEPLRVALHHVKESPDTRLPLSTICFTYMWGAILCVSLIILLIGVDKVMPDLTSQEENWFTFNFLPVLKMAPIILAEFSGMLFFPLLACIVSHPSRRGIVGWLLLAFTYVPVIFLPWDQDGFVRCLSLYVAAMVILMWPLAGTQRIASVVQSYWPLLIMILCLVTMPEMVGRCDMHPPVYWWERLRFNMGELILVVCFMSGGFKTSDPYNVTVWLGWWALYAYCFHVAWARLLGHPWGALLTLGSIVIFWALHACLSKPKSSAREATTPKSATTA